MQAKICGKNKGVVALVSELYKLTVEQNHLQFAWTCMENAWLCQKFLNQPHQLLIQLDRMRWIIENSKSWLTFWGRFTVFTCSTQSCGKILIRFVELWAIIEFFFNEKIVLLPSYETSGYRREHFMQNWRNLTTTLFTTARRKPASPH